MRWWISCGVCSLNICNDVTRASLNKIDPYFWGGGRLEEGRRKGGGGAEEGRRRGGGGVEEGRRIACGH